MTAVVAAIDQGTTGTTVLLLDRHQRVVGRGYREVAAQFPRPGWVEQDPEDHLRSTIEALGAARAMVAGGASIEAVGLTNQRETVVLWDRQTGRAVTPAIVWQDRRTEEICARLRQEGHEGEIQRETGLVIDPYFSATKIAWLLDETPGLRARAEAGQIAFGTVDSWLAYRLSGGKVHLTDVSNASRTLLFDIDELIFSEELCDLFRVPRAVLPEVVSSSGRLASLTGVEGIKDGTPLAGIAGDQQAALFGQGCLEPGDAKCTYGTGAFLLMNIGAAPTISRKRLLTSVAWQLDRVSAGEAPEPDLAYALEGSAFVAGALVQWLRDGLGIIERAADIEPLAASVPDSGGVTIVPALTGLGAPHWRPEARGVITGITRGTTRAHIARAALEGIALQIVELARAMEADAGQRLRALRVDGGATANDLLMQLQADLLGTRVERPALLEVTALGAARLAARAIDFFAAGASEPQVGPVTAFEPRLDDAQRAARLDRWHQAVARA